MANMKKFTEQTFNIPDLKGISKKNIEEHLKLYAGYVKHANLILEKIEEMIADAERNAYALGELQRRFSFEFDGMRNHEYYFRSLEGGAKALAAGSGFSKAAEAEWGATWLNRLKAVALTRGIGWAILYFDPVTKRLLMQWVDEQHLGHLNGCQYVVGIDMWEHSYVADYQPSGKKQYVEDFFANVNWDVVEANFKAASKF